MIAPLMSIDDAPPKNFGEEREKKKLLGTVFVRRMLFQSLG